MPLTIKPLTRFTPLPRSSAMTVPFRAPPISSGGGGKVVLDNPTQFTNPFRFEITFECLQQLEDGTCKERHSIESARSI